MLQGRLYYLNTSFSLMNYFIKIRNRKSKSAATFYIDAQCIFFVHIIYKMLVVITCLSLYVCDNIPGWG